MATLLDDRLVVDALTGLEGWTGDHERIWRTVTLDGDRVELLLAEVAQTADVMNHHPDVDRGDGSVTFTLSTHSAGGVTELDIALASRIDDLVRRSERVGPDASGQVRSVVGSPTEEGAVAGRTTQPEPGLPSAASVPSRPQESADSAGRPGTFHPPASPREGAGPVVAPDTEAGSVEPMPRGEGGPGMQEPREPEDEV